ncbi:MAG: hypothetical protein ACK5LM_06115 [Lactovum sp.]
MYKIREKWQSLIRLIILLVSISLIISGSFQFFRYFDDSKEEKKEQLALIIRDPEKEDWDEQLLEYEFDDRVYQSNPIDDYGNKFGSLGEKKKVYVQVSNPERIFFDEEVKREKVLASLLLGWGILLSLIVLIERRLLLILKKGKVEPRN